MWRQPRSQVILFARLLLLVGLIFVSMQASTYPGGYRLPFVDEHRITCGPGCNRHVDNAEHAVDFQALDGSMFDVIATEDGIARRKWNDELGHYLVIEHQGGQWSMYAHLDKFLVSDGTAVSRGQVVAKSGSSGEGGKGNHLHFEIRENISNGNFFSGKSVPIIDHPNIRYNPVTDCCERGRAIGEISDEQMLDRETGEANNIAGVWETRGFIQPSVEPYPLHDIMRLSQNGNRITGFTRREASVDGEIMYTESTFSGIIEGNQIIVQDVQQGRQTTVRGASWCSASSQRRIVEGTRMTYQYTRGSDCGTNVGNRGEFTLWKRSSP